MPGELDVKKLEQEAGYASGQQHAAQMTDQQTTKTTGSRGGVDNSDSFKSKMSDARTARMAEGKANEHAELDTVQKNGLHYEKQAAKTDDSPANSHPTQIGDPHYSQMSDSHVKQMLNSHVTQAGDIHVTHMGDTHVSQMGDSHATQMGDSHASQMDESDASQISGSHATHMSDSHASQMGDSDASQTSGSHATQMEDSRVSQMGDSHASQEGDSHASQTGDSPAPSQTGEFPPSKMNDQPITTSTHPLPADESDHGDLASRAGPPPPDTAGRDGRQLDRTDSLLSGQSSGGAAQPGLPLHEPTGEKTRRTYDLTQVFHVGLSCHDIQATQGATVSGIYLIHPPNLSQGPWSVYCSVSEAVGCEQEVNWLWQQYFLCQIFEH